MSLVVYGIVYDTNQDQHSMLCLFCILLTMNIFQNLLQIIRDNTSVHDVKASLSNLVSLGLEGEHMCYLITRVSIDNVLHHL